MRNFLKLESDRLLVGVLGNRSAAGSSSMVSGATMESFFSMVSLVPREKVKVESLLVVRVEAEGHTLAHQRLAELQD